MKKAKILAEAVVQACRTDILVHIIIKVCLLARLAAYLSPVRFPSLYVNDIVLPLDFVSHYTRAKKSSDMKNLFCYTCH